MRVWEPLGVQTTWYKPVPDRHVGRVTELSVPVTPEVDRSRSVSPLHKQGIDPPNSESVLPLVLVPFVGRSGPQCHFCPSAGSLATAVSTSFPAVAARACSTSRSGAGLSGGSAGPMWSPAARCEAAR